MFTSYDEYLRSSFSPDYWSDEGITQALRMLEAFGERDWEELLSESRDRPVEWKIRCAETMEGHCPFVREVLIGMLRDPDPEVVTAAADAFRCLPAPLTPLPPGVAERVSGIRDSAGPAVKAVLTEFLRRTAKSSPTT